MTTWFTGCTHFGHANIITYTKRPFVNALAMDARLISGWNCLVYPQDTVYHLGDVTLGDIDTFKSYMARLNGQIKIVPGNHDARWLKQYNSFSNPVYGRHGAITVLPPLVTLEFPFKETTPWPLVIVLCHYPMREWDRSHHGAIQLHSHTHGTIPQIGRSVDVSVESWDYLPVSLNQIISMFDISVQKPEPAR